MLLRLGRLRRWCGLGLRQLADFERIGPDRLRDVLQLGWAEVGDGEIEPPLHLAVGVLGQTDRAWRGDAFHRRGNIDAVAHQVAVVLLDHVTEVDADPKYNALILRHTGVTLDHGVLDFDRAAHSVHALRNSM